jgi:NAD(P)-dependent dehydrogenase (short-subunit alcohol dehydrogenase family)
MKLSSKVAIVTGAGAGIRRATSLLFAREGAKVAAVDVVSDGIQALVKEIHSAGGAAEAIVARFRARQMSSSAFRKRWADLGASTFCLTMRELWFPEKFTRSARRIGIAAWTSM